MYLSHSKVVYKYIYAFQVVYMCMICSLKGKHHAQEKLEKGKHTTYINMAYLELD